MLSCWMRSFRQQVVTVTTSIRPTQNQRWVSALTVSFHPIGWEATHDVDTDIWLQLFTASPGLSVWTIMLSGCCCNLQTSINKHCVQVVLTGFSDLLTLSQICSSVHLFQTRKKKDILLHFSSRLVPETNQEDKQLNSLTGNWLMKFMSSGVDIHVVWCHKKS